MDREKLLLLEEAAVNVLSPPFLVSSEQRKKAEAAFLELRKASHPYESCKYMLEHSQSDYVLFQAASTIKETVIREWLVLPSEEKESLKNYIIQYLAARPHLVNYVREQLVCSVAVMVKRATLEVDKQKLFGSILTTVSQLLTVNRHLSCSLLSALLTEFSHQSSSIGLPFGFHNQCKLAFQEDGLLQVLLTTTQVLQQYISIDPPLSPEDSSFLFSFLNVASQILSWDFSQFEAKQQSESELISWTPPQPYLRTFFDPSFLDLFFKLLERVLDSEDQLHHVMQCLIQLALLVSDDPTEQKRYLTTFVSGILGHLSISAELTQQEINGVSFILRRLSSTTFRPVASGHLSHHLDHLDSSLLELFMQSLVQLTCLCAHRAVQEEECKGDSLAYQESLEHFLIVWVNLLETGQNTKTFPHHLLSQSCVTILGAYIQSKLSAPRGWRTIQKDEDEIFEIDEDDRVTFADQLYSVAEIAQSNLGHSLPLLISLLERSTTECLELLSAIQQDHQVLCNGQNNLDSLYEDLHWLTLISCFTLCNASDDIPLKIMAHSISLQKFCLSEMANLDIRRLVLQDGGEKIDLRTLKLDSVVVLVVLVCRLCVMEKMFVESGLLEVLSPQLCETVLWCLSEIVQPYIMLDEDDSIHEQLSLSLLSVFGRDAPSSHWLVSFLVGEVFFNLSVWSAEEKVVLAAARLLKNIALSQYRAAAAIECDGLWALMRSFASSQPPYSSLPPSTQRTLMEALLLYGMGDRGHQYLTELLHPFEHRFTSLIQRPDFRTKFQDVELQQELLVILEALCGVALCGLTQVVWLAMAPEYFHYLLPLLQACVPLLELFADISEVVRVIFDLFCLVTEGYPCILDENQLGQLYGVCLALMQTYAKCNAGKYSKVPMVEEEQCDDLLHFMRLLIHLIRNSVEIDDQLVDMVITGIGMILPLMTDELLKFPSVCDQWFELLSITFRYFLGTADNQKMVDLFCVLSSMLEAGLTRYTSNICSKSLNSIFFMAYHYYNDPQLRNKQPVMRSLEQFMKILFEVMLSSSFDMENLGDACDAVFALICANKEYYSTLAGAIVAGQNDPQNQTRMAEAFAKLTPPSLHLVFFPEDKGEFQRNLREFLSFVKGFLYYR